MRKAAARLIANSLLVPASAFAKTGGAPVNPRRYKGVLVARRCVEASLYDNDRNPISDMLTRVRNAVGGGEKSVKNSLSSVKIRHRAGAKAEGFIRDLSRGG